jgi:hypothetical protein
MPANFHEQFEERVERPSDRSTGLVFAGASVVLAVVYRRNADIFVAAVVLSLLFASVSVFAPPLLRPLNAAWFALGRGLHRVVNPVVMAVLFFFVIVPFGYVMRWRYDPLRVRTGGDPKSYWIEHKAASAAGGMLSSMKNQF